MTGRRHALWILASGVINLAYAAAVLVFVAHGLLSAWVCLTVPFLIGVGLFSIREFAKHSELRWLPNDVRAAGSMPDALDPHAPHSLPAPARDLLHRSADLPARSDT